MSYARFISREHSTRASNIEMEDDTYSLIKCIDIIHVNNEGYRYRRGDAFVEMELLATDKQFFFFLPLMIHHLTVRLVQMKRMNMFYVIKTK